jgi:enoyl-CoA hydratase
VAKRDGGKIGLPEVKLGVLPGTGGTQRLARLLGRGRSIEMMVSGKLLSFDEAAACGLINQVLDADGFRDRILDYAREFVPPEGLALERELQQQLFLSSDAKEGMAAHLEKREAEFEGN